MDCIYSFILKIPSSSDVIGIITGDDINVYIGYGESYSSGSLLQVRKSSWDCIELGNHEDLVQGICVDTEHIYSVGYEGDLKWWKKNEGTLQREIRAHQDLIFSVTCDDHFLYTAARDSSVKIWDKITGKLMKTLNTHQVNECAFAFACEDKEYLYAVAEDTKIIIWKKENWHECTRLQGHTQQIYQICVDDEYIYSGSKDQTVKVWSKTTFELIQTITFDSPVTAIHRDTTYLYVGLTDGRLWFYSGKPRFLMGRWLDEHDNDIHTIYSDKHYFYFAGQGGKVIIWSYTALAQYFLENKRIVEKKIEDRLEKKYPTK